MPAQTAVELFGNAVGSTLVTTVFARARGAELFDVPGWEDPGARDVWHALGELAARRGYALEDLVLTDPMNVVGTIRRSEAIDRRVADFVADHPRAQVVTLGIGLCNRASRLAHLDATWIGIDHPDVVALRRELLPDEDVRLVGGSVADRGWVDELDAAAPTVFVAEGLLMYLPPALVTQLLTRSGDATRGAARFVADMHHTLIARIPAPIQRRTGAAYHFGANSPAAFARLSPGWRLVAADDTMAPISRWADRVSRAFALLSRGMMYGVVTLERDRR